MLRDLRARAQSFRGNGASGPAAPRILSFFLWIADADRRSFINFPALWAFSARWSEKVEATTREALTDLLAPARRAIEDGVASGELRRVDPEVACDILWTNYMAGLRRASIQGQAGRRDSPGRAGALAPEGVAAWVARPPAPRYNPTLSLPRNLRQTAVGCNARSGSGDVAERSKALPC